MMDIAEIATNLDSKAPGLWASKSNASISYPEDGHARCFELEEHSFWFKHRNRCITEIVRSFPPAGPVFDIGGGNGLVSLALQKAGFDSILVEPGPQGTNNALLRGLKTVICSTLEEAGFKPGVMSSVGLFDVIEHIEDDEAFLGLVHDYLSKNGQLYLSVPAYDLLWSNNDDFASHYRRYTISSLSRKLQKTGFEISFATYIFAVLPLPILLFRSLPHKMGFRSHVMLNQLRNEHAQPKGNLGRLFNSILQLELQALRQRRSIPLGASCLLVANAN